jgi:hypothetical protein
MSELVVFLAPDGPAGGVLDVLTDLSTAGLVDSFLWVRAAEVTSTGAGAVAVSHGRRRRVTVQAALADQVHDRVRLCVLVPLAGADPLVSMAEEQQLTRLVTMVAAATPMIRIRCILARPPDDRAPGEHVERDGWHNVLLAPEDAHGPGLNILPLPPTTDAVEIGRHAAPMIAGIVGLWSGVTGSPLDDMPVAQGVRVGRGFYRRVETRAVEQELRGRVLATLPELPQPRDHTVSSVYVDDVEGACGSMAWAWWTKHWKSLISERETPKKEPIIELGFRTALVWLFKFIWAALRDAPGDWYRSKLNQGAARAARKVHDVVFGSRDSAYSVVVNQRTRDGMPAGWGELVAATGELDERLVTSGAHPPPTRLDQRLIWQDYVAGAFTLADAGTRGGTDMPPVLVGANRGVLRSVTDCAPAPEHDFSAIPGRLEAHIGISRVAPGDVLGADALRRKLQHAGQDPSFAREADSTLEALSAWESQHDRGYSVQVGKLLFGNLAHVFGQIKDYLGILKAAGEEADLLDVRGRRALVRWMRVLLVLAVLAIVSTPVLAVTHVISVWGAVFIGLLPIVVWLAFAVLSFAREQREIFRDLNRRRELLSEVDAARINLARATKDLRRLSEAYEHYRIWSRIVGVVLRAPFGPPSSGAEARAQIVFGLPRAVKTAQAQIDEQAMAAVAAELRSELFAPGWLSEPWAAHCKGAGGQLGSHELAKSPERLLDLPGGIQGSYLQAWAELLVRTGTAPATGDALWAEVNRLLRGRRADLESVLLSSVRDSAAGSEMPTDLAGFLRGVDQDPAAAGNQRFTATVFSAQAQAADQPRVAVNSGRVVRAGLSVVAVLVQLTDAYPAYDFVVTDASDEHSDPGGSVSVGPEESPRLK